MRDDDRGRAVVDEQLLEPLDAVDVEVVRRFVEQQQLRFERERNGEGRTLALAARHAGRRRGAVETEPVQVLDESRLARASAPVRPRSSSSPPHAASASRTVGAFGSSGSCRTVTTRRPVGALQVAVVECSPSCDHVEQRRLAGAVAADQADALAGLEREFRAIEQWMCAECQFGTQEREQRHD